MVWRNSVKEKHLFNLFEIVMTTIYFFMILKKAISCFCNSDF